MSAPSRKRIELGRAPLKRAVRYSAVPLQADIYQHDRHVRFVPKAELVEEQVGEVVAFKVTGGHPLTVDGKEQYEVHFESTVRYPTGLYVTCKDRKAHGCEKLDYVEPVGVRHGAGKIVLEKTKDGWERPAWPY